MNRDVQSVHQLLLKYRFVEPVDESARAYLPASRKRALKYCLKKTGNYSLWFGLVLFILFTAKRFGFSISLAAGKIIVLISIAVVIAAASGGIVFASHLYAVYAKPAEVVTKPETPDNDASAGKTVQNTVTQVQQPVPDTAPQQVEKEPMEIILYTGKTYKGVILSRGKTLHVMTSQGEVSIPADKVKMIRRAPK
jgi:hypothetical protein